MHLRIPQQAEAVHPSSKMAAVSLTKEDWNVPDQAKSGARRGDRRRAGPWWLRHLQGRVCNDQLTLGFARRQGAERGPECRIRQSVGAAGEPAPGSVGR